MQPLSARCMRTLLRLRMGSHSLPIVLGRRTGVPRAQRLCQRCKLHAVHDERHLVFECRAMHSVCGIGTLPCSVLLTTPCSCSCGSATLWGWHTSSRIVFWVLGALDDAPDDASTSSSSALAAG